MMEGNRVQTLITIKNKKQKQTTLETERKNAKSDRVEVEKMETTLKKKHKEAKGVFDVDAPMTIVEVDTGL